MKKLLYSIVLELSPMTATMLPLTIGNQTHALFLKLIAQADPGLATRLHDEPGYRPFTVSSLMGGTRQGQHIYLKAGQPCYFRVTLLDGGLLWQNFSTHFLEARERKVTLGKAEFIILRLVSTPEADTMAGWASHCDWQALATTPIRNETVIHFTSPTAFSLGNRQFALYPEPMLVWDSLLRTWNLYAPDVLRMDKNSIRDFVAKNIVISDYKLQTTMQHFPKYIQKGFVGFCRYKIKAEEASATQIAALSEFAFYAGIGYKTTMGMGQVRLIKNDRHIIEDPDARGSGVEDVSRASRIEI